MTRNDMLLRRRVDLRMEELEQRACPAAVGITPELTIQENGPPGILTVALDSPPTRPVTVGYMVSGSARPGVDFRLMLGNRRLPSQLGRITFNRGETIKQISVVPINDNLREGDESFRFMLRPGGRVSLLNREATVTIRDDDSYTASIAPVSGAARLEPGQWHEFRMRLSAPASQTERFYLTTRDGSAIAGVNYWPVNKLPVTFLRGQTEARFRLRIADNPPGEYDKTFAIVAESFGPGAMAPVQATAVVRGIGPPPTFVNINSNSVVEGSSGERLLVFSATLSAPAPEAVSVDYVTFDGTATVADNDYRSTSGRLIFQPGERTKTISVPIIGDRKEEATETFSVVLSNPVGMVIQTGVGIGTIIDDDTGNPLPPAATFDPTTGWGIIDASAATARLLGRATAFPNVPNIGGVNWGNDLINAPEVWEQGITGQGIVVAVIDSGVDYNHPAISSQIVRGWDFFSNDIDPMDEIDPSIQPGLNGPQPGNLGHGTHVSGTIVAQQNSFSPTGVAFGSTVLAVRALGPRRTGPWQSVASAIRYAVDGGAHVINLSLGGTGSDAGVETEIRRAVALNRIIVAAAGNDELPSPDFPAWLATLPGVVSVGAINRNEQLASFSHGAGTDNRMKHIVAPGVDILSTVPLSLPAPRPVPQRPGTIVIDTPLGKFMEMNGTSMAAPHVSGAVALMLSALPDPRAPGVRDAVVESLRLTSRQPTVTPVVEPTPPGALAVSGFLGSQSAAITSAASVAIGPSSPAEALPARPLVGQAFDAAMRSRAVGLAFAQSSFSPVPQTATPASNRLQPAAWAFESAAWQMMEGDASRPRSKALQLFGTA